MSNGSKQTIFQLANSEQVRAIITLGGVIGVIFNIYLVAKLAPLALAISSLEARADHTDETILTFIPRAELEALIDPIKENVVEIKQDVRDIKAAINKL